MLVKALDPGTDPEGGESDLAGNDRDRSPWALAQMICARCTTRWGAVREAATLFSSYASSAVNVRTVSAMSCPPIEGWKEDRTTSEKHHLELSSSSIVLLEPVRVESYETIRYHPP